MAVSDILPLQALPKYYNASWVTHELGINLRDGLFQMQRNDVEQTSMTPEQ